MLVLSYVKFVVGIKKGDVFTLLLIKRKNNEDIFMTLDIDCSKSVQKFIENNEKLIISSVKKNNPVPSNTDVSIAEEIFKEVLVQYKNKKIVDFYSYVDLKIRLAVIQEKSENKLAVVEVSHFQEVLGKFKIKMLDLTKIRLSAKEKEYLFPYILAASNNGEFISFLFEYRKLPSPNDVKFLGDLDNKLWKKNEKYIIAMIFLMYYDYKYIGKFISIDRARS